MSQRYSRRKFFNRSLGVGTGFLFFKTLSPFVIGDKKSILPIIVTDHTNETGQKAMKTGWEILAGGGSAIDAIEKSTNVVELDPEDTSVGYGGLPNEDGVVQLDASIMDGKTFSAGAVACLENIKTPSSVARIIMEKTNHILLVGKGALDFAKKWGFKEENLLTEKARNIWLKWKENLNDSDNWGLPEHLRQRETAFQSQEMVYTYGTTNHLAIDQNGDIAGITSTSGLSFKIPGRSGDSPIIGAGLYVDNEVGAAGATGRGEEVIKTCASYYIVLRMKQGLTPQQACEDAMRMMIDKYKKVNPHYYPSEKFIALNKKGEFGCAFLSGTRPAQMTVANASGVNIYTGSVVFKSDK